MTRGAALYQQTSVNLMTRLSLSLCFTFCMFSLTHSHSTCRICTYARPSSHYIVIHVLCYLSSSFGIIIIIHNYRGNGRMTCYSRAKPVSAVSKESRKESVGVS
jgi:hypothetical protein